MEKGGRAPACPRVDSFESKAEAGVGARMLVGGGRETGWGEHVNTKGFLSVLHGPSAGGLGPEPGLGQQGPPPAQQPPHAEPKRLERGHV